jgi:phosphoribosylformylglycinamidine cyclo-ligase
MYQIFNMGHRLEIYCDESAAGLILEICRNFNLPAQRIGYTETGAGPDGNEVVILDQGQEFRY